MSTWYRVNSDYIMDLRQPKMFFINKFDMSMRIYTNMSESLAKIKMSEGKEFFYSIGLAECEPS